MKLDKVQITNFRCIDDSTEFKIGDVTCLVGKNESGKTTVLQAIEPLNPHESARNQYNRLRDYPRKHLADYEARHHSRPAIVVQSSWDLSDADVVILENVFGKGCLRTHTIQISKGYDTTDNTWIVQLESRKILDHLIEQAGCTPAEREGLQRFQASKPLHDHLVALADKATPSLQALRTKLASFRSGSIDLAAIDILQRKLPKFMYFSNYDRMSGDVSIEKLKEDIANKTVSSGDAVFLDFLKFSGTTLDDLSNVTQFEDLRARVEAASIKITRQIFEYWSQNRHLKVQFTIDSGRTGDPPPFNSGTVMRARIYNQLHDMTVPFSDRSAGFIWFFSFLVSFSQVQAQHGNVNILLDEPGLNLHGRAQGDLLRYIDERLKPNHQVIYTTHSPFMVPAGKIEDVRTVEDVVEQKGPFDFVSHGTKVGGDILSTDPDTLFPLQAALGYEITQSLFVGEHTLLVEGPSDVLYLQVLSNELRARGRMGLDRRWVVCPANGLDKVAAFVSLFGGNKLHVAVLLDYAKGQKAKVEQLKQSKLLADGHVFTITDFVEQDEGDVEDMLGLEAYLQIVNSAFNLPDAQKLSLPQVNECVPETPRAVVKVNAAFRVMPPQSPTFDHYTPAAWLIEHPAELKREGTLTTGALDRFEQLFGRLNALLPRR